MSVATKERRQTLGGIAGEVTRQKQRLKQYVEGRRVRKDPAHQEVVREVAAILDLSEDQAGQLVQKVARLFYMNGVI